MLQSEHKDFTGLMENLRDVFKREVDDKLIGLYWDALKDQPLTKVRFQVEKHIRYGKFFPKPNELREPLKKREPAPLILKPSPSDDDAIDKWAKTASDLLLKHITTRVPLDPRRYGDSTWTPANRLHCNPNMHERVAILVAYKNAWSADMRDEEAASGKVSKDFSLNNWNQLMIIAEREIDALIERDSTQQ